MERIEELVSALGAARLSRRRFTAILAAAGASAAGIGTLLAVAQRPAGPPAPTAAATPRRNLDLHTAHLAQQGGVVPQGQPVPRVTPEHRARVEALLKDYEQDAVVHDPLVGGPIMGHAAIRQRKLAEAQRLGGFTITPTHRFAHGDQVVAEWVAEGRLHGEWWGISGAGRPIALRGVTVVTRNAAGRIVRESLYYDLSELQRQLSSA